MTDLTISIINTNNRDLLDKCLETIYETTREISFEVVLVENCSTDGSAEMVREKYPEVKMLINSEKMGFTQNHNQVLRGFKGDYVVVLNEDTEIGPGCFDKMHRYLVDHPEVGVVGCKILNPDGTIQQSVYRVPDLSVLLFDAIFLSSVFPGVEYFGGFKRWDHNELREVPYMIGAILMFPRKVIETIGVMEEQFFLYADDADICKRVRDSGWKVVFTPDVEIIHHGGVTMGAMSERAFHNFYRSMHLFYRKHYGSHVLPFVKLFNITGAVNRIIIWSILSILLPHKKAYYKNKMEHFKRILSWYATGRYNDPP